MSYPRPSVALTGVVHAPWLGFHHDGHPPSPLSEYSKRRISQMNHVTSPTTPQERSQLYQSLFTFGLLEAVIEEHVPEAELLRKDRDGAVVITTEALPLIIRDWVHRFKESDQQQKAWFQRAEQALSQAEGMFRKAVMSAATTRRRGATAKTDKTVFVIAVIGEALDIALSQLPFDRQLPVSWEFVLSAHGDYRHSMVSKGWCPFVINMIDSVSANIYASSYDPAPSLKAHTACSTSACVANSIDPADYSAKHHGEDCTLCGYAGAPLQQIVDILSAGEIPVVTFDSSGDSTVTTTSASNVPYVAISHVWADGIGSTTEVGLPKCQLRRLASITENLVPGGAFWLDSLCVPELRAIRKKAIGLMGETYRRATKVLIIDSGIRACPIDAPLEQKLLRVLTSGWMQRLWTLQEAVLAKELVFEFDGGLITFMDLVPRGYLVTTVQAYLVRDIYRVTKGLFDSVPYTLADVAKSLKARSTSRAEDETLAVASLLGVEALGLVDLSPDHRMVALLCGVHNLPANILLLRGPKLDIPNFHWAPASLMGDNLKGRLDFGNTRAICTPEGLRCSYHFLYFSGTTISAGQDYFFLEETTKCLYMLVDLTPGAPDYNCNAILLSQKITAYTTEIFHCAAVLINDSFNEDSSGDPNLASDCEYKRPLLLQIATPHPADQNIIHSKAGFLNLQIV